MVLPPSSSSGVPVHDDCLEQFNILKLKKTLKYIIYGLNDKFTEIVVKSTSASTDYEDFIKELPENEPRWAVYDLEFEKEEGGGIRNKIIFYSWVPGDAKVKARMVAASSKEALRRLLLGVATEIQGTDYSEVDYETVLEKASKGA
ncbi:Actin depolymerizing factor [Mycena kentingensis (nom. inval.)]|nr:Actin depolymerizing factor [Mycena kentingensis (nom. inval.)]